MTPQVSPPELLTLHAVRLLGHADSARVAARFGIDPAVAHELLLDFEAAGLVSRAGFAGSWGWTISALGRQADEQQLAEELAQAGAADAVRAAHAAFLPLNATFQEVVTRWQIRPLPGDPLAHNDHADHRWDDRVLDQLGSLGAQLDPLVAGLAAALARFDGYATRYDAAWQRANRGEVRWVDAPEVASCHQVWFQLHEDLLATLGIERGGEDEAGPTR